MKCPNCNKEYDSPRYWCSECNYFFEPNDFLSFVNEEVVNKYRNVDNKCPIFPKDQGKIIFKNIDLQTNNFIYKSEYINGELSPEEFTIKYYEELGYNAIWTENNYWTILFFLYYFDDLGQSHTIYDLKFHLNKTQLGRTLDFTKLDDYSNNIYHIITSYYIHFIYFIARDSDKFLGEYFSIDELLLAFIYLNTEQVKLIFERLWDDFNYFKTGFPDLIVYNEKEFFFVEVKSKNDDPSLKQIQWHKFYLK